MKRRPHETQKNPLFSAIDKAPFAGKFIIKDAYVGFETASDTTKTIRAVGAVALLGTMVYLHAAQAKMGGESFLTHLGDADNGNVLSGALATLDAAYFGAMAAVTVRQASLTKDIIGKYKTWRSEKDTIPEAGRKVEKRPYTHSVGAMGLAVAVTAAGQLSFGASYLHAQEVEHQNRLDNLVQVDPLTPEEYEQQYGEIIDETYSGTPSPDPADIMPRDTIDVTVDISGTG